MTGHRAAPPRREPRLKPRSAVGKWSCCRQHRDIGQGVTDEEVEHLDLRPDKTQLLLIAHNLSELHHGTLYAAAHVISLPLCPGPRAPPPAGAPATAEQAVCTLAAFRPLPSLNQNQGTAVSNYQSAFVSAKLRYFIIRPKLRVPAF